MLPNNNFMLSAQNNGNGQGRRGFAGMTPAPGMYGNGNTGSSPRYVPPQRRQAMEYPIRPESSMSNASFATQAYAMDGGVSLRDLMNVGGQGGGQGGGGYGMNQQIVGRGAYGGYGGLGQGMMGGMGGMSAMGGRDFGHGRDSAVNHAFGQQAPPINQFDPFLGSNGANIGPGYGLPHPGYGALGAGHLITQAPTTTSSDSAHDSASGISKGARIADLIRSGMVDVEDYESSPPGARGFGHKQGRSSLSVNVTPNRPTRSTTAALLQPANPVNALVSVSNREGNTKGNAAAYLGVDIVAPPTWLLDMPAGCKPPMEMFFGVMPVIEASRYAVASTAGVVRINNIPYNTPRSEITAFVGRNAKIIAQPEGSPYHAVHIVMERHTGKTMDAFIEFSRPSEATWVVHQFQKKMLNGRTPRVGDRQVEVVLSSQEELMSELFPRAKNVRWEGATPCVLENNEMYYPGVQSAGFTGFLQNEEIVMVIKHAETPHRSPFAQRCLVRVYESHISTLHKYPWFAHEAVKMTERRLLFDATLALTRALIALLRRAGTQQVDTSKPTSATLQELAVAALTCPGFSEQQKAALVSCMKQGGYGSMTSPRGMNMQFGGNTSIAEHWPFKVLVRDPKASDEMVNYFASLICEATADGDALTLAIQHAMRASGGTALGPFGAVEFDYADATTVAEVGKIELRTIETLLGRVLPHSRPGSNSS